MIILKLYVLLNSDPYYYPVLISRINSVKVKKSSRIFVLDVDRDSYPDIVASDSILNTVGILFNPGKKYWEKLKNKSSSGNIWKFIPLIDIVEDKLTNKAIKDFTIYRVKKSKRINFELFILYDNKLRIILIKI
jgi:hypothetical protein